jgi:hypothetical protein
LRVVGTGATGGLKVEMILGKTPLVIANPVQAISGSFLVTITSFLT